MTSTLNKYKKAEEQSDLEKFQLRREKESLQQELNDFVNETKHKKNSIADKLQQQVNTVMSKLETKERLIDEQSAQISDLHEAKTNL